MCPGYMLNTMGFPGDKGGDELWYSYHYGSTMWCVGGITWHFADTKPGQSGSAVYYKSGSTRINYQIHGGSTWIPFTTVRRRALETTETLPSHSRGDRLRRTACTFLAQVNIAAKMDAAHFGSMCNFMDLCARAHPDTFAGCVWGGPTRLMRAGTFDFLAGTARTALAPPHTAKRAGLAPRLKQGCRQRAGLRVSCMCRLLLAHMEKKREARFGRQPAHLGCCGYGVVGEG